MLDSSQTKARQNKKFLELHALYRMGHHHAHQNHNLMYAESDENCKNLFLLWLQRPVMPMHNVCYSVLSTTLPPFVRRFHFFDHTTYKTKKRISSSCQQQDRCYGKRASGRNRKTRSATIRVIRKMVNQSYMQKIGKICSWVSPIPAVYSSIPQ